MLLIAVSSLVSLCAFGTQELPNQDSFQPYTNPSLCCAGAAPPSLGSEARHNLILDEILIGSITVANSVEAVAEKSKLKQLLEQAATDRAALEISKRSLAGHLPKLDPGQHYSLKASFSIPYTLPQGQSIWDAQFKRGPFMNGKVEIQDFEGKIVANQTVTLVWGDGKWTTGGGKISHARKLDDILTGFVQKAVDRGVGGLNKQLLDQRKRH